jgi:hypothetical protein
LRGTEEMHKGEEEEASERIDEEGGTELDR